MSEPDHGTVAEVGEAVDGVLRADGPVVVVTAMSLPRAARAALAQRLGPGHIVRDIREAGDTADLVLVPAVSGQLVGGLRAMFPGAKILVTELRDAEFGLDLPGPVSRVMDRGVDGYFVVPDLDQLAAVTREAVRGEPVGALTTGHPSRASRELGARGEGRAEPVLHLTSASESGRRAQPDCWFVDVDGWLEQLHPDGAGPLDRLRCTELAWTTAVQVLEAGLDVAVSGVDHEAWRRRAQQEGIAVVDDRQLPSAGATGLPADRDVTPERQIRTLQVHVR